MMRKRLVNRIDYLNSIRCIRSEFLKQGKVFPSDEVNYSEFVQLYREHFTLCESRTSITREVIKCYVFNFFMVTSFSS